MGYQLLLVPDFIAAAREAVLLIGEVKGEVAPQDPPVVANVAGRISGPLCIVYRTMRATREDIGAADRPEEPLLDRAGREIVLTYGFVCRGSRVVAPDEEDLRIARDVAVATYQRFHAAEETFLSETSRPYLVHSAVTPIEAAVSGSTASRPRAPVVAASKADTSRSLAPSTSLGLPDSQPRGAPPHRLRAIVVALAVLVLLVLAGGSYLILSGRHVQQVTVPNVANITIGKAEQQITKASLVWKISCPKAQSPGGSINSRVTGTKPSAGKSVDKGSQVLILVYPCPP